MGELERAYQLAEWLRGVALRDGLLDATAVFGVILGEVLLRQGRVGSAARIFQDSSGLLVERDHFGYRPWALAGLARAKALCGEPESASVLLDEARRTKAISRHFDVSLYLAEFEINRLSGRTDAAIETVRAGVAWARQAGMVGEEAQALAAWLRIAPSEEITQRLSELASVTESEFVTSLATYARAAFAEDAATLLAMADRFGDMGAWWLAAEAAAKAATAYEARHESRATKSAAGKAAGYADKCDGGQPVIDLIAGPVRLTKREREVAILVVAGISTKDIAQRMYLSPRTIENHLHRAYIKLGVTDRATLAAALAPEGADLASTA
jgi:DNA-binding NarL/FixJ family response regulator